MQERLGSEIPQEQFPTKRRKFCDVVAQELCTQLQLPAEEAACLDKLQHPQGQKDQAAHEGQSVGPMTNVSSIVIYKVLPMWHCM